ncbi:MAG: hypothetical protein AB7O59_00645 [Pirellulales bacterium]
MPLLFAAIDVPLIVGIVVPIGAGLVVVLTALLTGHYRQLQRDDMEATLKMEMIQRGMSAAEIEQVLAARMGKLSRHARQQQHQEWQRQQHELAQQRSAAPR